MPARSLRRSPVWILLLAVMAACGGGGGGGSPPGGGPSVPVADWYVSPTGSDAAAGTAAAPFRTITHALSVAASGEVVAAAPGTYDAAGGETFPLLVPDGVTLLGSESTKGAGVTPTEIVGGGVAPAPNPGSQFKATIVPGMGSTVAGFRVRDDEPPGATIDVAILLSAVSVTLRDNSVVGSEDGVYGWNAAGDHTIIGNDITDQSGSGVVFDGGGEGSRVESNRIVANATYGVEFRSVGGDLGGGIAGSAGHNVLSCNGVADVFSDVPSGTIAVCFDQWDHVAPLQTGGAGIDILNAGGATVVYVGASPTIGGCP